MVRIGGVQKALSDNLERPRGGKRDPISASLRADSEITQLKATVNALRDELEKTRIAEQERIQKAVAAANDEITQLKGTVNALRDELEKTRIAEQERIQRAVAAANDEITQLKGTVNALRDELDLGAKLSREGTRQIELDHQRERAELQRTLAEMRRTLEEFHAKSN
ncbi:MAG: hypothetical protein HY315_10170, partial [Acidobacteria bacterium]|nr:hypothetical protein [Acidobacteriota bacterium]